MTPTTCGHRYLDSSLHCTLPPHDGKGHVYHASNGSDVDDRHEGGGHG